MNTPLIPHEELRQRYDPNGSLLRRQQMRMLHILIEVDKICQRHSIRYQLSSGTLTGTVRYGGFIPWDDDLDIEMMRSDYERLLEILPHEPPDDLALQAHSTGPNYYYHYAKVRDCYSCIEERPNYDRFFKHRDIYTDIFPLGKQHMWTHKFPELSFGHAYKLMRTYKGSDEEYMKKVKRLYAWNVRFICPLLHLVSRITGTKTVTSGLGIPFHNPRYGEDIFPLMTITFKNRPFMALHDNNHMLRHIYDGYMELPGLNQLKPHTGSIEIYNNETNKHWQDMKESAKTDMAVSILFFNRPKELDNLFEQIKLARSSKLYLYQDGPHNDSNLPHMETCRKLLDDEQIDWECRARRNY